MVAIIMSLRIIVQSMPPPSDTWLYVTKEVSSVMHNQESLHSLCITKDEGGHG